MNRKVAFALVAALCLIWAANVHAVNELVQSLVFDTDSTDTGVRQAQGVVLAAPNATGGKAIGVPGEPLLVAWETTQPVKHVDRNGNIADVTDIPSRDSKGLVTISRSWGEKAQNGEPMPLVLDGTTRGQWVHVVNWPGKGSKAYPGVDSTGKVLALGDFIVNEYVAQYSTATVEVHGTFDATVTFESALHASGPWYPTPGLTSITAPGMFTAPIPVGYLRGKISTLNTGNPIVKVVLRE